MARCAAVLDPLSIDKIFSETIELPNISVIEDNDGLRAAIVDALLRRGFHSKGFVDGQDFLIHLPEVQTDCILSDVNMPDLGGLELLGRLQALDVKTPVILMSASWSWTMTNDCISRGAAAILYKPFSIEDLIGEIDKLMARDGSAS